MLISEVLQSNFDVKSAYKGIMPQILYELHKYLISKIVCCGKLLQAGQASKQCFPACGGSFRSG